MKRLLQSSALVLCLGCAGASPLSGQTSVRPTNLPAVAQPAVQGSYHVVQRGETLWRIAQAFGIDPTRLAAANRISRANQLNVGQRLFIPLPSESRRFLWPLRGSIQMGRTPHGVDIAAPSGGLVRASRSGVVAVAAKRLYGWGQTVVLHHADGTLSIYCGMDQILVQPKAPVQQGAPIGRIGTQALHFQIRQGSRSRSGPDTLVLLPRAE